MAEDRRRSLRSWLYVPGDRGSVLARAADRGADALILDLEDAVAADRKDVARALVGETLDAMAPDTGPSVWVRVNVTSIAADVTAVARPALDGIVLAKAEPEALAELDRVLTHVEEELSRARSPRVFPLQVVPLIETAAGLSEVTAIARAPRVRSLALGEADLTAELGVDPDDAVVLAALRMPVVIASASAGLVAPAGPVATDYRDLDALRASTRQLVAQGFRARSAIHPAQVDVINDVLTPSADEVASAREQVAAFEAAGGGATADDGTMVDAATVRAARDVLARAHAAGRGSDMSNSAAK